MLIYPQDGVVLDLLIYTALGRVLDGFPGQLREMEPGIMSGIFMSGSLHLPSCRLYFSFRFHASVEQTRREAE